MHVLVCVASRHGATAEIGEAIARQLGHHGLAVTFRPPEDVSSLDGVDAVVLGSAVYRGHWLGSAVRFADCHAEGLRRRPVWLFSSGPVGDPARALVRRMDADPIELPHLRSVTGARAHRRFPGRLDPADLPATQRLALRLVRGLAGDFRNWPTVRAWADTIAAELGAARRAAVG